MGKLALAADKANCRTTLKINAERVEFFKGLLLERGLTASNTVILILNVNDRKGEKIADILTPGFNWREICDCEKTPFLRGVARRELIQKLIELFDKEASDKLEVMADLAVVVVDYDVAEIFTA